MLQAISVVAARLWRQDECDRRIEYAVQPGTWACVHKGDGKKRRGANEIGTGAWHRAVGIDNDVPLWERIPYSAQRQHV
eukprot:COSAG01_NODE_149_length_24037_cov_98.384619_4_plen_79_part_00